VAVPRLNHRLTVRCTAAEREAWHAYAASLDTGLSDLTRTVLNNLAGVNVPPVLSLHSDAELVKWHAETRDGLRRRRDAWRGRGVGIAATVAAEPVYHLIHCGHWCLLPPFLC
jgi:hypothetical protein